MPLQNLEQSLAELATTSPTASRVFQRVERSADATLGHEALVGEA